MSQALVVALIRAGLGGAVLAGAAFFGALSGGADYRTAAIAAGVAFFGYLLTRGLAEGAYDSLPPTTSARLTGGPASPGPSGQGYAVSGQQPPPGPGVNA